MKALVSIITVNYNGLRDTCEMIDSFRSRETYPRYEIIVVDNGSRLPEAEEIQERYRDNPVPGGSLSGSPVSFPPVKVVRNINNGFAGGNNAGLKAAEGDYLFFINNDTLIKEPVLDALVRRIESDSPRNGGVSPMLKFAARPDTLQYAGFTPLSPVTLRNAAIGFMQQDSPRFRIPRETASLHGAAMMVSRRALQDAGTMSEVYFLFYEEVGTAPESRLPPVVRTRRRGLPQGRHDGEAGQPDTRILPVARTHAVRPPQPAGHRQIPVVRLPLHPRRPQKGGRVPAARTGRAGQSHDMRYLRRDI